MKRAWTVWVLTLALSASTFAQERAPSVGIALSWMELNNFQAALPSFELSQRVFLLYARGEVQIETGFALRVGAGWGGAFEGSPIGLTHYETSMALNFPFGRVGAYVEVGTGIMQFRQGAQEVWRLTGWVGAGWKLSLISRVSFFFEIMPLTLLDFNQPSLPWVWSYRAGVLWRF